MDEFMVGDRWETWKDGAGKIIRIFPTNRLAQLEMDTGRVLMFPYDALMQKLGDPVEAVPEPDRERVRYAATKLAQVRSEATGRDSKPTAQDYYDVLKVMGAFAEFDKKGE